MIVRDRMHSDVMDADAPDRETGVDNVAPRHVKGTIDIAEDIVMHHRDVLGHVLEVLLRQWGLATVEVRIRSNNGEAPSMTNCSSQQHLDLAGHSFPLTLTYC